MRLKTVASPALALACAVALAACGGGGHKTTATSSSVASTPPATSTTPPATTPATTTTTPQSGTRTLTIDETARLKLAHKISITHYIQKGTVTGTFSGAITLDAQLGAKGIVASFTAQVPGGTVTGTSLAQINIAGQKLDPINGTAQITGGTGRFAHAHASALKVTGGAALDGSQSVLRLSGVGTY